MQETYGAVSCPDKLVRILSVAITPPALTKSPGAILRETLLRVSFKDETNKDAFFN